MNKNKFFLKILFFFAVIFFFCSAKISFAEYMTKEQCEANKGSCNFLSNNCSDGQDNIGICSGSGPLNQGACCRAKNYNINPEGGTVGPSSGVNNNPYGAAAGGTVTPGTSGIPTPTAATSPITASPSGANENTGGLVPCKNNCTLCHLVLGFKNIYDYLLKLLLAATTLVVVVAGVIYMVSSGDKGMIDKAKSALTYALTAMILGLTAWLIINATLSALGYTKIGNWYTFTCDTTQTQGPTGGIGGGTLPGTPGYGNTGGTGCAAVVANINSMAGSAYVRGSNDCSSTTNRAYTNAGCKSPGGDSATMYANASQFTGAANLKAGDALVRNGHVGICLVDGCAQIMGASTAGGIRPGSGSSMINNPSVRVIKASDYCPASSC
jgi:hypothetical protein